MKFSKYAADSVLSIVLSVLCYVIILIFLLAYKVLGEATAVISTVYWLFHCAVFLCGYLRKRNFYNELIENTAQLDRKYLISEITQEPNFYEGKIIAEVLADISKSMYEQVAAEKHKVETFREFVELWVHEVKLPIASLTLMSHNDGLDGRYLRELSRVDECIENVLFYSRSENAEKDYLIKEVSLKRAFINTALKNRSELQIKNISLETDGLDIKLMTDEKWLEYILSQLFSNSIKYADEGKASVIKVSAKDTEKYTELVFEDNGTGIPKSDISRIFEKTFTGENGRTHKKSTGMGLYIVKSLCEKLGAVVSAESERGEFTRIRIRFGKNEFINLS